MSLHHNSSLSADSFSAESVGRRDKVYVDLELGDSGTVDVHLVIPLEDYEHQRRAQETFKSDELRIRYKVAIDLDAERQRFEELVTKTYQGDYGALLRKDELKRFEKHDLRQILYLLVEQGRNVFYRLFLGDEIVELYPPEDQKIILNAVRSVFSRPQVLVVYAESPLFPWNFLYYDDDYDSTNRASIDPEKFWGFFHEIQQEFTSTLHRVELPPDFKLLSAVDGEVDVDNWHTAKDHPFAHMNATPVHSISDLGSALGNFDGHCLYFFGHANHADPPVQSSSWLQLHHQRLTVSNMRIDFNAPRFNQIPVVAFLNGCRTSPLTKWNENTVVGFLCLRGKNRLCCVASVGELPPAFAAEFAKKFWSEFVIARRPIGTALLLARKHMLQNWNNPLGLLYSLFGRVDTFIKDE